MYVPSPLPLADVAPEEGGALCLAVFPIPTWLLSAQPSQQLPGVIDFIPQQP